MNEVQQVLFHDRESNEPVHDVRLRVSYGLVIASSRFMTARATIIHEATHQTAFNTGIIVDHVQEVLDIAAEQIEEPPQFGSSVDTDFILGMAKVGDSVKILLDIDKVMGSVELAGLQGTAA